MPPRHGRAHRAPPERGRGDPEGRVHPRPPSLSPARPERGRAEEPRCGHRSAAMCSPLRQCYFHQHRLAGQPPCPLPSWGGSAGAPEPAALCETAQSHRLGPPAPQRLPGAPLQRRVPSSPLSGTWGATRLQPPRAGDHPKALSGRGARIINYWHGEGTPCKRCFWAFNSGR